MNEKSLSLDLLEKGTNLCRFLSGEKDEKLISPKLFDAISCFCESCYSIKNTALSKIEIASLRKSAALESDKINLYLELLCTLGFISPAQKDSVAKTLDTLKKEINL